MKETDVIPDVEKTISNPQFDPSMRFSTDPAALMQKLAQQEAMAEAKNKLTLKDTIKDIDVKFTGDDSEDFLEEEDELDYSNMKKSDKILDDKDLRLEELEAELARIKATSSISSKPSHQPSISKSNPWIDPITGDETWYVQNISNGHVVISDIEMDAIKKGSCVDLLELAVLEDIKKSRDIKRAINTNSSKPLLKRLTPEQYADYNIKKEENAKRIEQYKQQAALRAAAGATNDRLKEKVRGVVLAKLEKLRLGTETDTPALGITPVEFIMWAENASLSLDEISYILGSTTDKDVRSFMFTLKVKAEKR